MNFLRIFTWFWTTYIATAQLTGNFYNDTTTLEKKILEGYDRSRRPVKNLSTPTLLRLLLIIEHLEEIDENAQAVSLHGWLEMRWNDEFLTWNREEYGGLSKTYLNNWQIWNPTLMLDNSAVGSANWHEYKRWGRATVKLAEDGVGSEVFLWPRFSFKFTCEMDFTQYPFDEQKCPMVIRAGVEPMSEVEIVNEEKVWLSLSWEENPWNNERSMSGWTVKNSPRQEVQYLYWRTNRVLSERPTNITFTRHTETWHWTILRFKRHAPYFGILIILPAVITSLMTISVFWLTVRSHGVYVAIVSIIIQGFCMNEMLMSMPPCTGRLPNVVIYHGINLTLSFLSIFILLFLMKMQTLQGPVPFPFTLLLQIRGYIPFFRTGNNPAEYDKMEQSEDTVENVEVNEDQPSTSEKFESFKQEKSNDTEWKQASETLTLFAAGFYTVFYFLCICSLFLGTAM